MKHLFLFLLFLLPVLLSAQDPLPANPRKLRLGYQTDGEGIVLYGSGVPSYTPTRYRSAFHYMDTTNNIYYQYNRIEAKWDTILAGAGAVADGVSVDNSTWSKIGGTDVQQALTKTDSLLGMIEEGATEIVVQTPTADSSRLKIYRDPALDSIAKIVDKRANAALPIELINTKDSTDQFFSRTYEKGEAVRTKYGALWTVTEDSVGAIKINDSTFLKLSNARTRFQNLKELQDNKNLIQDGSIVTLENGARYRISSQKPRWLDYAASGGSEGAPINATDFTNDSLTYFTMSGIDLPLSNIASSLSTFNNLTSLSGQPDFFGTGGAVKATATSTSDGTFRVLINTALLEVGQTYTFSAWFKRGDGIGNLDWDIDVEPRNTGVDVDINLEADTLWHYKEVQFVAEATGSPTNFVLIRMKTPDIGDYFFISRPQISFGSARGFIAAGQKRDEVIYYARLLPNDEGKVKFSWFENVEGDDSDKLQAAADFCSNDPTCSGIVLDRDLQFTTAGQTVDVTGDYGCVIEGQREGLINDDIRYKVYVNFADSTKTIFNFQPNTVNNDGLGLKNVWIDVRSSAGIAVKNNYVSFGTWKNIWITGNDNLLTGYETEGSNVFNRWDRFEIRGARVGIRNTAGNSQVFSMGRIIDSDTCIVGEGTYYHVGIENTGLPAVIASAFSHFYNLRGERIGGLYEDRGVNVVDLGGVRPMVQVNGRVTIYGLDFLSSMKDANDTFYAYPFNVGANGVLKVYGGYAVNFSEPVIRQDAGTAEIALYDVELPGSGPDSELFWSGIADRSNVSLYNYKGISADDAFTVNYYDQHINTYIDSAYVSKVYLGAPNTLDSMKSNNISVSSSAANYFSRSDFTGGLSFWNIGDVDTTQNLIAGVEAGTFGLLMENQGTATPADAPAFRSTHGGIAPGRYLVSLYVKPAETCSATSLTVHDASLSISDFGQTMTIDTTNTSYQHIAAVFDVEDATTAEVRFRFDNFQTGDSITLANAILYPVDKSFQLGPIDVRPGWVQTTGTQVTDADEFTWKLEDQFNLTNDIVKMDSAQVQTLRDAAGNLPTTGQIPVANADSTWSWGLSPAFDGGSLYITDADPDTLDFSASGGIYQQIQDLQATALDNFTSLSDSLIYGRSLTRPFTINFSMTVEGDTGSTFYNLEVKRNGTAITGCRVSEEYPSAGVEQNISGSCRVDLVDSDALTLEIMTPSASSQVIVRKANLTVH